VNAHRSVFVAAMFAGSSLAAGRSAPIAGPAGGAPASGTVTATDIRADGLECRVLAALGRNVPASFDATLEADAHRVKVTSLDGNSFCELHGDGALAATQPCVFVAGGGKARTTVTCPANGVSGTRTASGVHAVASGCRGTALGCDLEATLDVTVATK
jgi:hypothetical protein